jgi:iron(III) transport system substrate-binding protein
MQDLSTGFKRAGAPIDWFVIPPQIGRFQGVGVARRAAHPHAALLFADWLLSDGQVILAKRDILPANLKVNGPLRFIDPGKSLDERDKWSALYQEIVVDRSS